mmetsp:Transcript_91419/g.153147  ORF Transcript_91419/g.153147 Transcript_91419/m.153147 type:complete len:154 (+) Transcript_91419:1143-1604(+)
MGQPAVCASAAVAVHYSLGRRGAFGVALLRCQSTNQTRCVTPACLRNSQAAALPAPSAPSAVDDCMPPPNVGGPFAAAWRTRHPPHCQQQAIGDRCSARKASVVAQPKSYVADGGTSGGRKKTDRRLAAAVLPTPFLAFPWGSPPSASDHRFC